MRNSIKAVYLMHSLNGLAGSFIGIFIPIYLLTLHYSVAQVFTYYLTLYVAILFLFILAGIVSEHLGLKRTLLAYFPLQLAYFGLLYVLPHISIPLWVIAVTSAATVAFYWYPLHMFFVMQAQKKEMGGAVGKLYALPKFVAVASPLIGAFIVTRGGFSLLFILTIVLYLATSLSLLYLPENRPPMQFKMKRFIALARNYPRYIFAEIGENLREELGGIVLPIIIFLTFGSILSVGFVGTLASFGSALFILLIGHYADRLKRTNILRAGTVITMAIWTGFFYVHGTIPFYVLTLLEGFFGALLLIPFNALVYDYAQQNEAPAEFIVFREIPVTLARVLVYGIGLIFVTSLRYLFLLPVFGSLLFWVL